MSFLPYNAHPVYQRTKWVKESRVTTEKERGKLKYREDHCRASGVRYPEEALVHSTYIYVCLVCPAPENWKSSIDEVKRIVLVLAMGEGRRTPKETICLLSLTVLSLAVVAVLLRR